MTTGTPCNGPRGPVLLISSSRAAAADSASERMSEFHRCESASCLTVSNVFGGQLNNVDFGAHHVVRTLSRDAVNIGINHVLPDFFSMLFIKEIACFYSVQRSLLHCAALACTSPIETDKRLVKRRHQPGPQKHVAIGQAAHPR